MKHRLFAATVVLSILACGIVYITITSSAQEIRQSRNEPTPSSGWFIVEGVTMTVPVINAAMQHAAPVAATMSENFEGDWPGTGWQVGDYSSNDGGEYLWDKRNCHPHTGAAGGWFVGGGAQGSMLVCLDHYPNNAFIWATYGPFDLSHATSAHLTFYIWGTIEVVQGCAKDALFALHSTDPTGFSEGAAFCGDFTNGSVGNGYTQYKLDLSNRLGQSQVWIGFIFLSDNNGTGNGIIIDDITLDVVEDTDIFSCNNVTELPTSECEALVALYNSTNGTNWINHIGWLSTNTPCSWYGITCGNNHVIKLELPNNQLNGTLPAQLSSLLSLQNLSLYANQIGGTIPIELGGLSKLTLLSLSDNHFTGAIPTNLGNLTNLQVLHAHGNQLSSGIPLQLGSLANLLELDLATNQLSGGIPSQLGSLAKLQKLGLGWNQLSGSIPPELGQLTELTGLNLSTNQLTGGLPSQFGNLVNLDFLSIENNQLSGPLPVNLTNLTKLVHFWFNNTGLCEPEDTAFQNWLTNIPSLMGTGVFCTPAPTSTFTPTSTPTNTATPTSTPVTGGDNFQEDFSTDPYTNGHWQIFRQASDSGVLDNDAGVFYLTRDVRWQSSIMFANYTISSHVWNASFRFKAGGQSNGACGDQGGDGITFFFYANTFTPGSGRIPPPEQGYSIKLDNYTGRWCDVISGELINYIAVMKGDTILSAVQDNRVEDNQWHTINIEFNNGKIIINIDGSTVMNYQIETPNYTFSTMGFNAVTGNATNDHIIDDFIFTPEAMITYSISGHVIDNSGNCRSDVTVTTNTDKSAFTNANGNYTISGLAAGTYMLTASKSGCTFTSSQLVTVPPDRTEVNFIGMQSQLPTGFEPVIFIPGIAGSQLKLPDEYLWPVYLDGPKLKMTLKPDKQNKGIYTDDVIRTYDAFNILHKPIYGPIIKRLSDAKYLEYKTGNDPNKRRLAGCDTSQKDAMLFVFPWDWRFGVADAVEPALSMSPNNVDLLAEYIGCIQKIHPDKKVNIVAHSMGGLLARNYILSHPSTHNVHQLISIDTPWLGAPKAISMMLTGNFDTRIINLDTTRTLLEYFPGAHQLLPSKQYYDLLTSSNEYPLVALEGGIFNLEQYVNVAYPDFDKYLHSLYVSPAEGENYVSSVAFMGNNEKLYNDPKFADWNGDQSGVEYHVLTGKTTVDDTVYRVVKMANITWYGDLHFRYDERLTKGDKTVPEKSQTRLGNGKNLNGQVKSLHQFVARKDESVKHEDMPSNIRVQDCILAILQKTSSCDSDEVTAAASTTQPVRYQRIWGVKSLQITNSVSTTANLMTSTLSLNIFPNITLDYLGDDSVLLIILDDKQYTVIAQAKNSLYIKSTFGTDANTLQYESFEPSIVVTGTIVALSTSQSNLANLKVDTDGDGVPETNSIPISSLGGDEANDSTPPTITAQYDQLAKMLTIGAMDTGSGILKVLYSLDGVSYLPYTQSVKLEPTQIDVVYAISQDKAGNWSDIVQIPTAYPIYLPLIIQK